MSWTKLSVKESDFPSGFLAFKDKNQAKQNKMTQKKLIAPNL